MAGLRSVVAIHRNNNIKVSKPNLQNIEAIGLSQSLATLLGKDKFN
jgi:hypothetical protein